MTPLERVARAIGQVDDPGNDSPRLAEHYKYHASAALKAIRSPTGDMIRAALAQQGLDGDEWIPTQQMWQAMIAEALK